MRLLKGASVHLARVRGNVVCSVKASGLSSHKLLLVQDVLPQAPWEDKPTDVAGPAYIAIDLTGAGDDEIVLVTRGSAARVDDGGASVPTDAAVIGIVDSVHFAGEVTFVKT